MQNMLNESRIKSEGCGREKFTRSCRKSNSARLEHICSLYCLSYPVSQTKNQTIISKFSSVSKYVYTSIQTHKELEHYQNFGDTSEPPQRGLCKMLVTIYQTTRSHISRYFCLYFYHHNNFIAYI
jgi:hypothetical protein